MPKRPADRSFRKLTALAVLERTGMSVVLHSRAMVLLILCVCVASVAGDLEKVCSIEDRNPVAGGLCGERLTETVELVCGLYGYHSTGFQLQRRSAKWRAGGYKNTGKEPNRSGLDHLMLTKSGAMSYLTKRQVAFGRQGITCECCFNQCSTVELSQYC